MSLTWADDVGDGELDDGATRPFPAVAGLISRWPGASGVVEVDEQARPRFAVRRPG